MHALFFTSGISRLSYLAGRLTAALTANAFVLLGWGAGVAVGTVLENPDVVGPVVLMNYVRPYFVFMLPTRVISSFARSQTTSVKSG